MIKSSELIKIVVADGWNVYRIKGSHYLLKHPIKKGIMIIPHHGSRTLGKGLVLKIFKQAGIEWQK